MFSCYYCNMPKCKIRAYIVGILCVHILNFIRALYYSDHVGVQLRLSCSYVSVSALSYKRCVTHTHTYNGLKVALNNEIPVSTSLSFCILQRLRAMHSTHCDVSLLISYKYFILIFSYLKDLFFMQIGCRVKFISPSVIP